MTNSQLSIKSGENLRIIANHNERKSVVVKVNDAENAMVEIGAGEHSQLNVYMIFDGKSSLTVACDIRGDASVTLFHLTKDAECSQNSIIVNLQGENANIELYGLVFGCRNERHVFQSKIVHFVPDCTSRETVKTILRDQSQCVFDGLVLVEQHAQKTDSQMTNRNLLLSDDATIETSPQLEIYADDVKCSHGATSGQLDRDALFYFRSRGISEQRALQLLVDGFAGEIIEKIEDVTIKNMMSEKL